MIKIENLNKSFMMRGERKYVARDVNITIPEKASVGLLGRNGAGKSTLLKILAGTLKPDSGKITSTGDVSWQIGFAGSFHHELTGAQNVRFVARIYGVDTEELSAFVQDFAELGPSFHMPFRTYSSGMRSRLAFGVSMGVPFSFYLIDEVTSVGDAAFRRKCKEVLKARLQHSGAIVVSHSSSTLRSLCTSGAVLEKGRLNWHDDIRGAIKEHDRRMAKS